MLGQAKDIDVVLEALLIERGLRTKHERYDPPKISLEGREDLRDLLTFTIDPETAKDFDDAISIQREGDGLRAWVHIADVSYFVRPGMPLDGGAADRAFSYYIPGRVAPMLPHELADDLCSLRPHVDRLCVTVEVPFGPGLELGRPRFYRSVIRSDARLSYGQAEKILAGKERAEPPLAEALKLAERLSAELRRRRFARGALRVESTEIQFAFDRKGGVARAWREEEPNAHALIEELMILANECVARFLTRRKRGALYRVHEKPDPQSVELLISRLGELDVPTPPVPKKMGETAAEKVAAQAAERVVAYVKRGTRGREAFPSLVLRALKRARYDEHNLGHSGLASEAYCHFTSPIRRYPDLVCHRALLLELGQGDDAPPKELTELAEHCSLRERNAAEVEYLADDLCLAWLLEARLFELGWETTFSGEITGIIDSGLFIRFGEVFEGYLPARRLPDDYFEISPLGTALTGRRSKRTYRLGNPIEVRVAELRKNEGKVELTLGSESRSARPEKGRSRRR